MSTFRARGCTDTADSAREDKCVPHPPPPPMQRSGINTIVRIRDGRMVQCACLSRSQSRSCISQTMNSFARTAHAAPWSPGYCKIEYPSEFVPVQRRNNVHISGAYLHVMFCGDRHVCSHVHVPIFTHRVAIAVGSMCVSACTVQNTHRQCIYEPAKTTAPTGCTYIPALSPSMSDW